MDYGNFFLLNSIAHQTGLVDVLKEIFPDIWSEILTCAFYEVSERKALYLCGLWTKSTATVEGGTLPSQRISELLHDLGIRDRDRMSFFRLWAKKRSEQECIAYDITSVSSYSKLNEFLEFGYNRDGEDLPQINIAMLFGETSLLPIFYSTLQGSIRDMSAISNMLKYAEELDVKHVRFVMDKGFYSDANLKEMADNSLKYAIAVPFTTTVSKAVVDKFRKKLQSPSLTFAVNGEIIQGMAVEKIIKGQRGMVFIYFNERLYLDQKQGLLKRILRLEHTLEGKRSVPPRTTDPCMKYLKIRRSKDGLRISRNEDEIEKSLRYKGYMVMMSNDVRSAEDCLSLYRAKDIVEKAFDNMKNELDMKRLRTHSETSMHGRTFIAFIGLILHSWIDKRMKEKRMYKRFSQEEVMSELKRLKIIELANGMKILTEVSKHQAYLFKEFGVPVPNIDLL
jgi:transposase